MTSPNRREMALGLAFLPTFGGGLSAAAEEAERVPSASFEIDPSGHLFLTATVAGHSLAAILDSGAGRNVIDVSAAGRLGLTITGAAKSVGMTGDLTTARVNLPEMEVGGRRLGNGEATAIDLTAMAATAGRPIDLVLGRPFFENASVDIDFTDKKLTVEPITLRQGKAGFSLLPLRTADHGRLYTRAEVERSGSTDAMYDLGSAVPLYVSPAFAALLGLFDGRPSSQTATMGVEGMAISRIATARRVSVGPYTVRDVPVQVPETWNQEAPVLIGLPFWRRFRNVIDLSGAALQIKPDVTVFQEAFERDRSGIGAQRLSDRLRVVFISPGSPAERAGLKVGDEVVSVDGVPCGPTLYRSRLRPGAEPAGTVEQLGLASGAAVTLELADYF